jgi:hypothetical protein
MTANPVDTGPPSVRVAVSLMWWAFGVHAFLTTFMIFTAAGTAFAVGLVLFAFLPWAIGRGLNWARIAQLVLIVSFVPIYAIAVWQKGNFSLVPTRIFDYTVDAIRFGFHLAAAALLVRRDARLWFQQIRLAKQASAV